MRADMASPLPAILIIPAKELISDAGLASDSPKSAHQPNAFDFHLCAGVGLLMRRQRVRVADPRLMASTGDVRSRGQTSDSTVCIDGTAAMSSGVLSTSTRKTVVLEVIKRPTFRQSVRSERHPV